jgi:hypothetical protein
MLRVLVIDPSSSRVAAAPGILGYSPHERRAIGSTSSSAGLPRSHQKIAETAAK